MSKIDMHDRILDKMHDTYIKKNADYGNSFAKTWEEYGPIMLAIRLQDKLERFKKLTLKGDQQVSDESIEDTLLDLANYATLGIIEIQAARQGNPGIQEE